MFTRHASVTLDNDQIKALPTTPITVVTAPNSDQLIIPVRGFLFTNFTAGAYAAHADASAWLYVDDVALSAILSSSVTPMQAALQSTTRTLMDIACPFLGVGAGTFADIVTPDFFGTDYTTAKGRALKLADGYAGVADYTGGNAANTMVVAVHYCVWNDSTKAFD